MLRAEKDKLIKASSFRRDIMAKGIKSLKKKKAYFEPYHVIISGIVFLYLFLGSYIYFYKIRTDLVP